MTDLTAFGAPAAKGQAKSLLSLDERTRKRNAAEARFRLLGKAAVAFGIIALVGLLASILSNGLSSFQQTYITIDVYLDPAKLDPSGTGDRAAIAKVSTFGYAPLIQKALGDAIAAKGLASEGLTPKAVGELISKDGPANLRNYVLADPSVIGKTVSFDLLAAGRIDGYYKGRVTMESAKLDRNVSPEQLVLADKLKEAGILVTKFNWSFFTSADASDTRPEAAGLGIAIIGSAYMMLIVLVLSLPIGVATSIYLEEFAPQNWFTDLIEVNIANLAAVPSIVFGILGLAVLINFVGLPQSAPIVGGLVLTLMTLPTIIIATRSALKAVPPSIRDAALGVGASKMQSIFHHVLPLAMPGILTGAIIGLARALGETAPLLLIGMVAFVKEFPAGPPDGFFQPASALPVQVYNWTQRGDPAFVERASGAIIVLLVFLILMNLVAIILRRRFERRW
ncbi:phosphate ABC transporter permease PstA [Rhizobium glycinendophyticum]|uniref:Phosphate transport system permease protein PstA n=1 Tax=Rhizobium glycinendophyticum TaxID=2589807 RepID=A0A504UX28_9HYPH|nr:phosphate ABC transporter permease PstA [Rhizobium glycinendophyticum]TPP09722.1 phosphate ABC transporter permease PstA [Rhizobium glycinendophyticum]